MRKHGFLFALIPLLALALLFTACTPPAEDNSNPGTSGTSALPIISIHPTSGDYVSGATIRDLRVQASASDGGAITYQWYENTTFSNTGGTEITGAKNASYPPQLGSKTENFYYAVVTNTKTGSAPRTNTSNPARVRILDAAEAAPAVTVNITNANQQYVRGFGGMSNAFAIGAPARYMELKDIDTMFNPDTGLGFNILRIMIWPKPLEDVINGEVEPQMNNQITYLEVVKRVNKYGGYVLASPWTPPPEWKVNESEAGTAPSYLLPVHYRDYAEYLKNYARSMASYGAPIYAISIQNEPSWPASYAGCEWTSQQQVDFFTTSGIGKFMTGVAGYGGGKALNPNDSVNPQSVKVMSGEAHQNVTWNNAARDNPTAHAAIDIYAFHTYGNHSNSYTAVQADNDNNRKEVWMTEWNINSGEGNYEQDSKWEFVWVFADAVDNDVRCDNVNAFVWWYLKRFYCFIGDNAFGTVNNEILPRGYILSHWAKYATDTVRVPATVTGHPAVGNTSDNNSTTGYSSSIKVKASAFRRKANPASYWEKQVPEKKREDSISLVIYDKRTTADAEGQNIRVNLPADFGDAQYASAIISDSTGNRHAPHLVVLASDGKTADFYLPANSIVSIKFAK
ncbi:glucuronoxylanase xynC [Treponema sp. R8-4-B8]